VLKTPETRGFGVRRPAPQSGRGRTFMVLTLHCAPDNDRDRHVAQIRGLRPASECPSRPQFEGTETSGGQDPLVSIKSMFMK
jgi:hypothetical protein